MSDRTSTKPLPVDLGPIGRYADYLAGELKSGGFASKGERTRFRLKLAAVEALERDGYQDLKVAVICRRARVALGTFYVYFPDKAAIATEVMLQFGDALYAQAQQVARGSSGYEAILLTNQFFCAAYQHNAGLIRCLVQLEDQVPEFRGRWRERRLAWLGRIAGSIARRAATPVPPEPLRLQIAYALEGMVFQYLFDVFVRAEPTLSRIAGKPEHIAELLSILWYRAVYGENPPAGEVSHAKAALELRLAGRPGRKASAGGARP